MVGLLRRAIVGANALKLKHEHASYKTHAVVRSLVENRQAVFCRPFPSNTVRTRWYCGFRIARCGNRRFSIPYSLPRFSDSMVASLHSNVAVACAPPSAGDLV